VDSLYVQPGNSQKPICNSNAGCERRPLLPSVSKQHLHRSLKKVQNGTGLQVTIIYLSVLSNTTNYSNHPLKKIVTCFCISPTSCSAASMTPTRRWDTISHPLITHSLITSRDAHHQYFERVTKRWPHIHATHATRNAVKRWDMGHLDDLKKKKCLSKDGTSSWLQNHTNISRGLRRVWLYSCLLNWL